MNVKSQATIYYSYDLEGTSFKSVSTSNTLSTPLKIASFFAKKIANTNYFKPGDIITYTIVINNASNFKVTNISIKDLIDNQIFIKDSLHYYYLNQEGKDVSYLIDNEKLEFRVEELLPSTVLIISYKAKAKENLELYEELQNYSKITTNEGNEISITDLNLTQKYAKVICEKSVLNDYAYLNSSLTYKIVVKNIGNYKATDLEVVDELPETFRLSKENPIFINGKETQDYTFNNEKSILTIPFEILDPLDEIEIIINGSIVK